MILTRTMTLECDLPDAPEGCEWVLITSDSAQVSLDRGDKRLGFLTGIGGHPALGVSANLYPVPPEFESIEGTKHKTEREAALALFAALGLEVHP